MPKVDQDGGDERVRRSKDAVLAATYKLLTEGGIGGVSVDEVSRRSKVSKTTIYRHWPSRSALLLDACSKIGTRPEAPDTGSLQGDLAVLVAHLARQLQSPGWPTVLPSIIDAAERDPELAELHTRIHVGLMAPFFEVIERAKKRKEFPPVMPSADVVAAIVGPIFYRRWFSREPIDDPFLKHVVRSIGARINPE